MEEGVKTTREAVTLRLEPLSAIKPTTRSLNQVSHTEFLQSTLEDIYRENDLKASEQKAMRRPLHHLVIGIILLAFSFLMLILKFENPEQPKLPYLIRAILALGFSGYFLLRKQQPQADL
ncbi:MAG: hypothetical protein J5I59_03300 [Saprospiraceae bacterium]|nr:hypothetical protein [Saprospiraceae bacterium]